jgi:septum formation protein
LEFEVLVPEVEEEREGDPEEVVVANARRKARAAVGQVAGEALVIGCDTEVVLDRALLGQPGDEAEAQAYLARLSGREHEVLSGLVVVRKGGTERSGIERSVVRFRELDEGEIARYVDSGEWRGRAGGYAVQGLGSTLVEGIEGDISNVIGLPIGLLLGLAPELMRLTPTPPA